MKLVRVTWPQVLAARAMVRRLEATGRPVGRSLARIARLGDPVECQCWATVRVSDDEIHMTPINDAVTHALTTDECICGVSVECIQRESSGDCWLYVHHSLDGREAREHSV